jgi:hypothetical protein
MIWKAAEGNGLSFAFGIGDDRYIDLRLNAQGILSPTGRRWEVLAALGLMEAEMKAGSGGLNGKRVS